MTHSELPEDVRKAAMFHLRSMEPDVEQKAGGEWQIKGFGLRDAIARAILAERKRCADVANERALHLAQGAEAMPGDASFATQMVEALLIEQRIKQGWVAKETMQIEGLSA